MNISCCFPYYHYITHTYTHTCISRLSECTYIRMPPPPLHWPGKNYLGPGTRDFSAQPVDEADYIARLHDLAYAEATSDSDIFKADKAAIREFLSAWHNDPSAVSALAGSAGLSIKNFVEETILGRTLYGMSKRPASDDSVTQKNWAAIRRINQNRAFNRQLIDAAEQAEAQQQQERPPTTHASPDTPPNSQSLADNNSTGNISGVAEQTMDVDQDAVAASSTGAGGTSGGSTGASGGQGDSDVYRGTPQSSNYHTETFNKSYHFSVANGLPQWRRVNDGALGWCNELQLQSVHAIPWERLGFYCSEGEILRLMRNYAYCEVEEVTCEVYSLGVRLPFITGQTTSLVANTLAQIPIGKFNFDQDHFTMYGQGAAMLQKCWGAEWKTYNLSPTDYSNQFPNLSASTGNRTLVNPVSVMYPMVGNDQMFPKDVGIYDYVDIKNGSTTYGPAWSETYRPRRGIINAKSCESDDPQFQPRDFQGRVIVNGGQYWASANGALVDNYNGTNRVPMPTSLENRNIIKSNINLDTRHVLVENNTLFAAGDSRVGNKAMPKFMIGIVNIRNLAEGSTVNSVLEARWDIMVKCSVKVKCGDNVQRGYINRVVENVPFAMNPFTYLAYGETLVHLSALGSQTSGLYGKLVMGPHLSITARQEIAVNTKKIQDKEKTVNQVIIPYKELLDQALKHKVSNPEYIQQLKIMSNANTYNGTLTDRDVKRTLHSTINRTAK
uniref:VP n=1 Tax=Tarsiger cyanurus parvoviridae sp. TaxID=2794540 RepID=A0A8E7G2H3_9VIRU|nr:MAG: VP [Tarsiger cyanurus parvoviridae sp.]